MANSIDIGINFVEPNDDGKKREVEPQSEKPKKTSSKGKSSTGPSATQLTQDQLNRIKELEAKYKKGKITGPEAAEYLKLANVKVGERLKELLSKGNAWVGGKEILSGRPLQRIQDKYGTRGRPNEIKNSLRAQMTKAMDKAAKNILSQVVATQPSPDIVADVTNQAIEEVVEEKATEEVVPKSSSTPKESSNDESKNFIDPKVHPGHGSVFKDESGNEYVLLKHRHGKVEGAPIVDGKAVINKDSIKSFYVGTGDTTRKTDTLELTNRNYYVDKAQKQLDDWKSKNKTESTFGESPVRFKTGTSFIGNKITDHFGLRKNVETIDQYVEYAANKYWKGSDLNYSNYDNAVKQFQDILKPGANREDIKADRDIPNFGDKSDEDVINYLLKRWSEMKADIDAQKNNISETISSQSIIPASKKSESNTRKDIFSYATEENAQQFEEQESKRKQEQASRQKEAEDKARKMVEDAIMPVEDSLKDINDAIAKIGTGAGSGDGGKGKGPKAPPGFGDDDDMGDDGDINDDFGPFPTLRARIENLQRTFKSTLYAEKDANLFSSLQKTFEKGRRAEDYDALQKVIEEEVRAQMKLLLAFETRNENLRYSLEATLVEKIRKEANKPEEKQDKEAFDWLVARLEEVRESRNKIQSEFDKIETEITSTLSERATSGMLTGKIERDIRQMEVQGKEEDKIIGTYMKEFSKYVKAEYKQIANKQASEVAYQTMEANKDKMKSSELLKKMKVAYDKEFTRVMDTIPTETELTREEILAAHEAGQGKFAPEAFRPKGASPEYTARQPSATGGSGGTGGPGTPTTTSGWPEDIPPSRENLSAILPPPKVDMDKVRENFARWALIKEATKPMVSASTPQGTTGSEVLGTTAAVGGGALALGVISGPIAAMAVGVIQMTGILAQIAENTAKEVTPFSPELIMAKVEQSLTRLNINMAIANASGRDLANYQKSSNLLSNQLYELGVDIWDTSDKQVTFLIDALSFIVSILRIFVIIGSAIWKIQEVVLYPLYISVRQLAKTGEYITNLLSGRKTATVRDYTEDFMANDLRPRNNNRNQ